MKRGKSLKRDFKKAASAYGLNWKDWLVISESEFYIVLQKSQTELQSALTNTQEERK